MNRHARTGTVVAALGVALLGAGVGCKKKKPAAVTQSPAVAVDAGAPCPDTAQLAALIGANAATLATGCFSFSYGPYWMAGVLARDAAGTPQKLHLVAGGTSPGALLFDIDQAPMAEIQALAKRNEKVEVSLRAPKSGQRLLRLGVAGRRGAADRPEGEEIALAFQLVAHGAPRIVWMGEGDHVTTEGDCVVKKRVEVDTLFGNRLEIFTTYEARPVRKDGPACPSPGMGSQESAPMRSVPLAPGRPVGRGDGGTD